jgi:hypothetical protein
LKYYNSEMHTASFAQPSQLQQVIYFLKLWFNILVWLLILKFISQIAVGRKFKKLHKIRAKKIFFSIWFHRLAGIYRNYFSQIYFKKFQE